MRAKDDALFHCEERPRALQEFNLLAWKYFISIAHFASLYIFFDLKANLDSYMQCISDEIYCLVRNYALQIAIGVKRLNYLRSDF